MSTPAISLIAAVSRNAGIGRNNDLLWSDPADQRHFRQSTMGHAVAMGRRTWDSLPARFRPLPGRRNVVITRQPQWRAEGAEAARSWTEAMTLLAPCARVFVIGGAQIYALALPQASEILLTEVDALWDADAFFPDFDRAQWVAEPGAPRVDAEGRRFRFVRYTRTL